jgi:hypothetical protein
MKVIGKAGSDTYLCEVRHSELEKLTDKYYGNLKRLEVGDTLDLGEGYDFRNDIRTACSGAADAIKRFHSVAGSLHKFAVMVGDLPEVPKPAPIEQG